MSERKIIVTSTIIKQSLRYLFARHLSAQKGLPDNFMHIRQFVIACWGNPELRENLIKNLESLREFGINPEQIIIDIQTFKKEYFINATVYKNIAELNKKFEGTKKNPQLVYELKKIIREMNLKLPAINDSVYIAFIALTHNTDLCNEYAPKEDILTPDSYTFDKQLQRPSRKEVEEEVY